MSIEQLFWEEDTTIWRGFTKSNDCFSFCNPLRKIISRYSLMVAWWNRSNTATHITSKWFNHWFPEDDDLHTLGKKNDIFNFMGGICESSWTSLFKWPTKVPICYKVSTLWWQTECESYRWPCVPSVQNRACARCEKIRKTDKSVNEAHGIQRKIITQQC